MGRPGKEGGAELDVPGDGIRAMAFSPDGQTLAVERKAMTVELWDVQRPEVVRRLHDPGSQLPLHLECRSAALSTDRKTLALAGLDGMVRLWDVNSGEVKIIMALLPENEWIAYHPQTLLYNASAQGDAYAAIRFGSGLGPVYPLTDHREELQRFNLGEALHLPQPGIKPKRPGK